MNRDLNLGCSRLDETHVESLALLDALRQAHGDDFVEKFTDFCRHTEAHFSNEERLMQESGFRLVAEHSGEHRTLLGELRRFEKRLREGNKAFAQAYANDRLPEWLQRHITHIDSQFALYLKSQGLC